MRILFTAWPLAGHLHPLVEIARELNARGHRVAVYCAERTRYSIEREGLEFFPYRRIDETLLDRVLLSPERSVRWTNPSRLIRLLRQWLVETVPGQIEDIERILESWRPHVIVCDESMWGPTLILQEKHRLNVVPVSVLAGCLLPGPDAPLPAMGAGPPGNPVSRIFHQAVRAAEAAASSGLRRSLNVFRIQHGLPPLRTSLRTAVADSPLYLVRGAPEFDYNRRDLPPQVQYVGPLPWRGHSGGQSPDWLSHLSPDRPVIFVSEGTMQLRPPLLLRAATQGLANLDMQVILATGFHRDPASLDLGPVAPNIRVERWVPQQELLAQADLAITFGGCGTVFGALSEGVPLLVVPEESDQPANARRVVEAGAGVQLSRRRCTPRNLRNAVECVLGEPSYRTAARRMAQMFARFQGLRTAADLIEGLVKSEEKEPNHASQELLGAESVLSAPASIA